MLGRTEDTIIVPLEISSEEVNMLKNEKDKCNNDSIRLFIRDVLLSQISKEALRLESLYSRYQTENIPKVSNKILNICR